MNGLKVYRADIDGLRAIAICSVIGFHVFPEAVRGGFVGVDIFFIISGYLVTAIILHGLESNIFSFASFYARRIKRIFPSLILVLFTCYIFSWFVLLPTEFKQLGKHIASAAGFIANFIFWREIGYFDGSAETKPLLHIWSLGVEEQFYVICPLLLYVVWSKRFLVLPTIIATVSISFVINLSLIHI